MNKARPALPKSMKSNKKIIHPVARPGSSQTPNFGRSSSNPAARENSFNESLDVSEISRKERLDIDFSGHFPLDENFKPECKSFYRNVEEQGIKFEKALKLLDSNLKSFQIETDQKILDVHEQVAFIRFSIRSHVNVRENIEKKVEKAVKAAKNCIDLQFSNICKDFNRVSRCSKENIEKLHSLHECYDLKLQENEDYLKNLEISTKNERSKSSIPNFFSSIAEENKRMREDLSKLRNNPN
jgi:hypothetical protein